MGSINIKARNLYKIVEENYITKVGGTYSKIAEEINYFTTEEGISMYSNTSIDMKAEGITTMGESTDPPEKEEQLITNFITVVQFYRSNEQEQGDYGTKDTTYKGAFGFDKFDTKIHAKGLVQHYTKFNITTLSKDIIKKKPYLQYIPYLSIWPPGNPAGAPSTVTLYLKAEEATILKDSKGKIKLQSSNANIVVPTVAIELEIGGTLVPITIECKGTFASPVTISAVLDGDPSKKVGQLMVYPNDIRYKTIIQPVEIKLATTESKVITKKSHTSFFTNLLKDFNTKAFNQAYIYGKLATDTHQITLAKSQFNKFFTNETDGNLYLIKKSESDPLTQEYNDLVEDRYASLLANKVVQNKAEEQLKQTINKLLTAFDNEYKDKGKVEKQHKNKIATKAWQHPKVQSAYKDYQKALGTYNSLGRAGNLNKTGIIHLFYTKDIHAAKNPTNKVLAYSSLSSGVAHVFDSGLIAKDSNPTVLHEIGHSFGLNHTFDNDSLGEYEERQAGKLYKEDLEKEIDMLEKKLKRKENEMKNPVDQNFIALRSRYKLIERSTMNKNYFQTDTTRIQVQFIDVILKVITAESQELVNGGVDTKKLNTEISKLKTQIALKKQQKKTAGKLVKLSNAKSQSNTLENYMDYPQNTSGTTNADMERKVFYKWQWDKMRAIGKNKYLKPLP